MPRNATPPPDDLPSLGHNQGPELEPIDTLEHPPIRLNQPDRQAAAQAFDSGAISDRPDDPIRSESALEHPPIRLNQPDRQAAAQPIESGAISDRPDDPIRSESALEPLDLDDDDEGEIAEERETAEISSFTILDVPTSDARAGVHVIIEAVKGLPNAPGVYRMIGVDDEVLYVGKARNLKKRVVNYTRPIGLSNRILRMTQATARMEFITTKTETEALLLEANLIKRLRPRFNVLLRDDKSFPYILITGDHAAPMLAKHRGARDRKGQYFGPFASAGAVKRTIDALQKAFLVRTCTDSIYDSRTRPCLLHQIKRCAAPCTGEISLPDYAMLVQEAQDFLSGKSAVVKEHMAEEMKAASDTWDFERAARFRDRLAALSHVSSHQGINPVGVEEADLFAAYEEGGQICVQVFFFRTGQNWGNHAFFPKADKGMELPEVMESFIGQFYDDKPVPRQILTSHDFEELDLLARALSEKADHKVEILNPKRGEKRDLVDQAITNAREALGRRMADTSSQAKLLDGVARIFHLPAPPRRIEVYDNSHIMGTNAVGCMIVAGPDGFMKNQYRKFNIKSTEITPGDDFGMMREMLTRRFSRLLKEQPNRNAGVAEDQTVPWPDLVLIDGGRGQLNAVRTVLAEIGVTDLPLVGVAKGPDHGREGREKFHLPDQPDFLLPERDPVLYFIQRLRDEAHRFAIGTHRAKRSKEISRGTLEEIPGVGPTRKRALLNHFGTLKAIQRAAKEDIEAVPGISSATAQAIWAFFQG